MKLIDADKLKAHYAWWADENKKLFDEIVDAQPEVDAVPVVHGRWKKILQNHDGTSDYECSACLGIILNVPDDDEHELVKYCPMCGAIMDGGDDT